MFIGVDCIEGGSWCVITEDEISFFPFVKSRREVAQLIDRLVSMSFSTERGKGMSITALARGYNDIPIAGYYSPMTLARAVVLERVLASLSARMIPCASRKLEEIAGFLNIKNEYVSAKAPPDRTHISYMMMQEKKGVFKSIDKGAREKHAVSAMLAVYCERYSKQKHMLFY